MWSLTFAPLVPLPLLIGLAVLAAVAAGMALVLAGRGAILRALALAVLAIAVAILKLVYWRSIDAWPPPQARGDAVGLGRLRR